MYIEKLKEENPELYTKVLNLAVNIENLPRRQKRATQRAILKMINNGQHNRHTSS